MKRFYFIMMFLSSFVSGCSVKEIGDETDKEGFLVRYEDGLGDAFSRWCPGDEISINGYRYITETGGMEVRFVPAGEPVPASPSYFAVYPADVPVDGMTVSGTFAEIQRPVADSLPGRGSDAAVAKTSGRSLVFQRTSSYASVRIMTEGVKGITIRSNNDEVLWGEYVMDYSETRPSVAVTGGDAQVRIEPSEGEVFPEGTQLYFLLPPKTLKSGFVFSASIHTSEGQVTWEQSVSEHTVFYRGRMLDLGDFFYDHVSGLGRLDYNSEVDITIDCTAPLEEKVSSMLFGSFSEMHGGDLVPGILEQYIVNTSFEPWEKAGAKGEIKNELVYAEEEIPEDADVAYPWEKRILAGQAYFSTVQEEKLNTLMSQKVSVAPESKAVLMQRLALPSYRVDRYKVSFYAKAEGDVSLKVSFHDVGAKEGTVLSDVFTLPVPSGDWTKYEHEFILRKSSSLFNDRHGQYNLWIEFEGNGTVYMDHATLFPSDCIDGIFNPETVRYFQEYGLQAVRWPGGNYTSGYNWKNGIGPWVDRPCLKNMAWGGLDSNLLGTDEFMRFCDLIGVEPVMGVGYNTSLIPPQDIVDWVEYCNGDASTEYGAKRALNGNVAPYGVKYWGIGNEVYGSYQIGSADASSYSEGLSSISSQMKAVDPSVCILASGRGVHNQYRGNYQGWTETVASGAASAFDVMDCHMYVYGNDTSADLGLDGAGWFRVFAGANLNLRDFISYFRTVVPDKELAFMEWGVLPSLSGKAWQTPKRQTFANLLVSACIYNEMIRNSDVVSMAALHNFSFYVAPHKLHSEPVNMRTSLVRELAVTAGGCSLPVNHSAVPVYDQMYDMLDVGIREGVPELDVAAVKKERYVYLSCVNRSLTEEYTLNYILEGASVVKASGRTYTCASPFVQSNWAAPVDCIIRPAMTEKDGKLSVPPLSYTFLKVAVEE